jgi:hypothetical protein
MGCDPYRARRMNAFLTLRTAGSGFPWAKKISELSRLGVQKTRFRAGAECRVEAKRATRPDFYVVVFA